MPRFDRTGPRGLGPVTGRGTGYGAAYQEPGYGNAILGPTLVPYGGMSTMYGRQSGSGTAGRWFGWTGGHGFGRGRRRNR